MQGTGDRRQGTGEGKPLQICHCNLAIANCQFAIRTAAARRTTYSVLSTQYSVLSTPYSPRATSLLLVFLTLQFLLALPKTRAAEPSSYADRLSALAAKCDDLELKEQAELTRRWIIPRHPGRQYLFLPAVSDPAAPKSGATDLAAKWYAKFRELRGEQAEALFAESKQALADQRPARAYQLLHEVLRENPDHAEARRILGYIKDGRRQWTTPEWERMAARRGAGAHPIFGMSYWRLESPHFELVTNHSSREALEAGRQLEDLHALWRQIFFRYWSTQAGLAARFAGGREPLARERPKMKVVLFRNREEYVEHLLPAEPRIGLTLGIYMDKRRTSYFYAGDTSVYPTWYHEATHQLFQEGVPGVTDNPGQNQNFWALEGVALYMESLQKRGHSTFYEHWTAGGCEADRLQFARYRALAGDYYVPLSRLVTFGRAQVQADPEIRKLYAQAAGLSHFLIDGDGGKHQGAFIDLLTAIYQGNDGVDTLAKATGTPHEQLDDQYRACLNVTDDDLAHIPDVSHVKNLSLGRTSITDAGLAHLAGCKNLEWLDLSLTEVSDEGLKSVSSAAGLKQLFLEGTKITDAGLATIASHKQLEELDLSKLAITDAGLAKIAGLKNLKILYLTGSPITDAGLTHLRSLKQLETLETTATQVTPEGLQGLKSALPKLQVTNDK